MQIIARKSLLFVNLSTQLSFIFPFLPNFLHTKTAPSHSFFIPLTLSHLHLYPHSSPHILATAKWVFPGHNRHWLLFKCRHLNCSYSRYLVFHSGSYFLEVACRFTEDLCKPSHSHCHWGTSSSNQGHSITPYATEDIFSISMLPIG